LHPDKDNPKQVKQIELVALNHKSTKAEFPGCYPNLSKNRSNVLIHMPRLSFWALISTLLLCL
jgi:hypothetical protein